MVNYRTGNHWGTTIILTGSGQPDDQGRKQDDQLVAVIMNNDKELAERIVRALNSTENVAPPIPALPAPPVKVEIDADGRSVSIEAPGTTAELTDAALSMWRQLDVPEKRTIEAATGFVLERANTLAFEEEYPGTA